MAAFDEIEHAHGALGETGPDRRTLTQQRNNSYVSLLAAGFQGTSRALHSEAAAQANLQAQMVPGDHRRIKVGAAFAAPGWVMRAARRQRSSVRVP